MTVKDVAKMKFSQAWISPHFREGPSIASVLEEALRHEWMPAFPVLQYVKGEDPVTGDAVLRSCDNRRLCFAKTLWGLLGETVKGTKMITQEIKGGVCPGLRYGPGKKYSRDEVPLRNPTQGAMDGDAEVCPGDLVLRFLPFRSRGLVEKQPVARLVVDMARQVRPPPSQIEQQEYRRLRRLILPSRVRPKYGRLARGPFQKRGGLF